MNFSRCRRNGRRVAALVFDLCHDSEESVRACGFELCPPTRGYRWLLVVRGPTQKRAKQTLHRPQRMVISIRPPLLPLPIIVVVVLSQSPPHTAATTALHPP